MKRITVFIISALIAFSLSAVDIAIAPYNAFSGVPVGNSYYHANASGEWTNGKWTGGGTGINSGTENKYTDEEMIGVVSVQESSYFNIAGSITISASAPNGLYMVSQSEPSYKRPIEIWFYPSYGYMANWGSVDNRLGKSYNKQLTNDSPSATWFEESDETPDGLLTGTYDSIWFDVVLVLPGKLKDDTNEIEVTENGKTIYYPLVKASDYSSIVTITVTYTPWDGSTPIVSTLTIPFTGYYDPATGGKIQDATVSMNVTLESTAYNLNLEKQGTLIDIGEITYMAEAEKSVIFFSSSSDPFYNGDGAFTMVKSGLGVNTQLTSQNSLGFKIRVSKPSGSSLYSKDYIEYDGTLYVDKTLTSGSVTQKKLADAGMIVPVQETYDLQHQKDVTKYTYSSRIYLIFDTSEVLMLSGRYTEDVYVHVLTYE